MYCGFHSDQWPNCKEKPGTIFVPLTFLLGQDILCDQPPAIPVSPVFLNKVGSVTTELLPGRRKVVPAPFSKVIWLNLQEVKHLRCPLCQEGPGVPSPPTHVAHKPSPWDKCPNIKPGKTTSVSKLQSKGQWDTEKIIIQKSREELPWA